jgi:hypothetical protein
VSSFLSHVPHHGVLPCHKSPNNVPNDHELKPPKLWTKINFFLFKMIYLRYFVRVMEKLTGSGGWNDFSKDSEFIICLHLSSYLRPQGSLWKRFFQTHLTSTKS